MGGDHKCPVRPSATKWLARNAVRKCQLMAFLDRSAMQHSPVLSMLGGTCALIPVTDRTSAENALSVSPEGSPHPPYLPV